MKKLAAAIALATLLPLAGCATPYGYSPGAWANYDGGYDSGYQGYGGGCCSRAGYGDAYYSSQPYYYGGYYDQPAYAPPPAYGPSWYSTYYSGCGCNRY